MKKSLIALAVLAATGAAMAQSSVTLYGKANIGFSKAGTAAVAMTGGSDGSDSRWGIRGTEDLGGGLKANFTFENGFKPDTGSFDNTANQLFQRQSWVGLSGGFGEVRLGRQYTLGFYGSIGNMPSTAVGSQLAAGLGFNGMGSRNSDQIAYYTPNMNGFQGRVSTQLDGDTTNAPTTEYALVYAKGPLTVNVTGASKDGTFGDTFAINASYNAGVATIAAGIVDNKGIGGTTSAAVNKGSWIQVGLNNMGAFAPFVGFAKNDTTGVDASEFGTFYALSKRTRLYALYGNKSPATGADVRTLAAGLDHNF